jgi:hypothetical protein
MLKSQIYMNTSLEASQLGFKPGHWPETMVYKDHLFKKVSLKFLPGNELAYCEFQCETPNKVWTLKVYND